MAGFSRAAATAVVVATCAGLQSFSSTSCPTYVGTRCSSSRSPAQTSRRAARWVPVHPGRRLDLLPEEAGPIMLLPSVSTVTFYEGQAPVQHLREKAAELCTANRWLAARLRSRRRQVYLWVPTRVDPVATFCELERADLRPNADMATLLEELKPALVPRGQDALDQDIPLFKVSVVHTKHSHFALVVSLSHVLGDGHTYYRLIRGLSESASAPSWLPFFFGSSGVEGLKPHRKFEFPPAMAMAVGPSKLAWVNSLPARIGTLIGRLFRPAHRWTAWRVSQQWVKAEKTRSTGAAGTPYVSTNDVLTSWFLRRGRYEYGFMSLNFRGRLCGLQDDHAGNYKGGIQFWPDEFATPAGIRRSLRVPPQYRAGRRDTPGLWRSLRSRFGVVTNWASIAEEVRLPGCKQIIHLPVLGPILIDGAMVIFRPKAGELGVALGERREPSPGMDNALDMQYC